MLVPSLFFTAALLPLSPVCPPHHLSHCWTPDCAACVLRVSVDRASAGVHALTHPRSIYPDHPL